MIAISKPFRLFSHFHFDAGRGRKQKKRKKEKAKKVETFLFVFFFFFGSNNKEKGPMDGIGKPTIFVLQMLKPVTGL